MKGKFFMSWGCRLGEGASSSGPKAIVEAVGPDSLQLKMTGQRGRLVDASFELTFIAR
jgi:hypothetical protein